MASPRVRRLRRAARSGEVQVSAAAPVAKAAPAPVAAPVVEEVCEDDPCEVEECDLLGKVIGQCADNIFD